MELQELTLTAITVQARFRLAPAFADKRGAMLQALIDEHELQDYGWGDSVLTVWNPEQTRRLIIGSSELRISYEHVERLDDFIDAARRFLDYGVRELGIETVEFLGVRSYWLAAADSFEELRAWLGDWLTPENPLTAAVASQPSDVGWVFEYRDQSPEHVVRVGPMKVDQLVDGIFGTSQRDLFPENFLFVDLDRILRGEKAPSGPDLVAKVEESIEKTVGVGERFGAAVRDRTNAG